MLNRLKIWVGNDQDETSINLREMIETSKNKFQQRKTAQRYHYDGNEIDLNKWLEKLQSSWIYNGETYKKTQNDGVCERCGKKNIVYEFFIRNEYTGSVEIIGKECVKRFNFSVMDENHRTIPKNKIAKKVDQDKRKLIKGESRIRRLIALVALEHARKKKDQNFSINFENFIEFALKHDGFTPKMIRVLSWKLNEHGIIHRAEDFKMLLTKKKYRDDLNKYKKEQKWVFDQMLPYMPKSQKRSMRI